GGPMRCALIRVLLVAVTVYLVPPACGLELALAQDGAADTIRKLDQGLAAAARSKDQRALGRLLAAKFTWTDGQGRTWPKSDVVRNIAAFPVLAESDVKVNFYGPIATVTGQRGNFRFVRIWVKRLLGWRLFLLLDTPIPAQPPAQASVEAGAGQGDCDNPCRALPYSPRSDTDNAIVAAWQQTKLLELNPNAEEVARYIADEFLIINNTTMRNREQRIAIAKAAEEP